MRTFTFSIPPKITPGIVATYIPWEKEFVVKLGDQSKLANETCVRLFKPNPPDAVALKKNTVLIHEAYPTEIELKGKQYIVLSKPAKLTPDIMLVHVNMGGRANPKLRGSAWPEKGTPLMIACTLVARKLDAWPEWDMDAIWSMAPGDGLRIKYEDGECLLTNHSGELVIL